jgi:hypothetical protein
MTEERKKPRIVARHPDDHHPIPITEDDFAYFQLQGPEQLAALKKQIGEREKIHFDLRMLREQLDGNPEPGVHEPLAPRCSCGVCELRRTEALLTANEYSIRRLRSMYARLS